LRGSRVAALGLTSTASANPDRMEVAGRMVPSAYRAFAYLGGAEQPLPSVVAPLGPIPDRGRLQAFWQAYYAGTIESLSLEEGMRRGLQASGAPTLPMALFLRHRHTRLFRRQAAPSTALSFAQGPESLNPVQAGAELAISRRLVDRLSALATKYGSATPPSVSEFLSQEPTHQGRLAASLEPWVKADE
jgi:hypothetical protein